MRWLLLLCAACAGEPPPELAPAEGVVVIAGQSNAVGGAPVTEVTVADDLHELHHGVSLTQRLALRLGDPLEELVLDTRPLQPRFGAFMGVELTLGRALHEGFGPVGLVKLAVNGSGLEANWHPDAAFPVLPEGTPNLYRQLVGYIEETTAALEAPLLAVVWIHGNSDANRQDRAEAYGANLADLVGQLRADLGCEVPFVFDRLHPEVAAEFTAIVRDQQAAFAAGSSGVVMIDTDDLALRDLDHYTADSFALLGDRLATAILPAQPCP